MKIEVKENEELYMDLQNLFGEGVIKKVYVEYIEDTDYVSINEVIELGYEIHALYLELFNGKKIIISVSEWGTIRGKSEW